MTTIEERLQAHKQNLNSVQTPSELEGRLRNALEHVPTKKRKVNKTMICLASSAAALLLIVGTYQYPAFAYYGGKLLNQMELYSLSFAEVEEQGYGQTINKSKTLPDGTVITINGVIADDNALSLYYTIDRQTGTIYDENGSYRYGLDKIQGFLTDSKPRGGGGSFISKDKTHYEGVYKFDPVSPFSRTLTVTFFEWLDNGKRATYPIQFKYEPNKAMKSIIKENISKSIPVDQGKVYYDSITASPTSTIVKGHYEIDELDDEGFPRFQGETKLYVNGTEMKPNVARGGDTEFELEFDVLPTDRIENIELVLANFPGYQKVEEPISLASPSDKSITIGNEKVWIRSVTKTDTGYDIVIARKQFTILEKEHLSVQAGDIVVPVSSISSSRPWDLKNGNILWEQTYSFNTMEKPERLLLDGFHYIKTYDKTISIPVGSKK